MNWPKTFCLVLNEFPERATRAMGHLVSSGIQATPFYGIYGPKFHLTTDMPNERVAAAKEAHYKQVVGLPTKRDPTKPYYVTPGHIGCSLSHYMLWQTCMHLPDDYFLVFEDDIVLTHGFADIFERIVPTLPDDWEFAFVGYYFLPDSAQITRVGKYLRKTNISPLCTHAYMVHKRGLPKLLAEGFRIWCHVDEQLREYVMPRMNYYLFPDGLAKQLSFEHYQQTVLVKNQENIDSAQRSLTYDWNFIDWPPKG